MLGKEEIEQQRQQAFAALNSMSDEARTEFFKYTRAHAAMMHANILEDYNHHVHSYHDAIVKYITCNLTDKTFLKMLNAIDTFGSFEDVTQKLLELDVNVNESAHENNDEDFDSLEFSMLHLSYVYWIKERNVYMEMYLDTFANESDKNVISNIIKVSEDGICIPILEYIYKNIDTIEYSENSEI